MIHTYHIGDSLVSFSRAATALFGGVGRRTVLLLRRPFETGISRIVLRTSRSAQFCQVLIP